MDNIERTPENALRAGSKKTWNEWLDLNSDKGVKQNIDSYINLINQDIDIHGAFGIFIMYPIESL